MGLGKINIWISDVANPCGTWKGNATVTVFDCRGILEWSCGRYLHDGKWIPVPGGKYTGLPTECGHLEVEVPPGCYWVSSGYVGSNAGYIHLNGNTHVGIVEVGCDQTACVKLYMPTIRLCWNWFLVGLKTLAARNVIPAENAAKLERMGEELMAQVPKHPDEGVAVQALMDIIKQATVHK